MLKDGASLQISWSGEEIYLAYVKFSCLCENLCLMAMRMSTKCSFKSVQFNCAHSGEEQGPAGSYFQLRDGSGLGIGKNFGFGSGIGYWVLEILIGYFRVHPNIVQFLYKG